MIRSWFEDSSVLILEKGDYIEFSFNGKAVQLKKEVIDNADFDTSVDLFEDLTRKLQVSL